MSSDVTVRLLVLYLAYCASSHCLAAEPAPAIRFATFNIQELSWPKLQQVDETGRGSHPQLVAAATILQQIRPDIVLINEIDYTGPVDADGEPPAGKDAAAEFLRRYLAVPRAGLEPLAYPYRFYAPSNTGTPSNIDLNGDSKLDGPNDAYGFGRYPGEYAMVLLSRFPLDAADARTFRKLLWKEMPGNLLPDGTAGKPAFYSPQSVNVFRLSSKSHWDVPVTIGGRAIHLLCSHPTPPIFDGPEDANGRRNHDELRFWSDYLAGSPKSAWIVDDRGRRGGLAADAEFVILGDLNSDPVRSEADYGRRPIEWVLKDARVKDPQPTSPGAAEQSNPQSLSDYLPYKTSNFGRLDYVLPSKGLAVGGTGVYWPAQGEPGAENARLASDHRLVWVDLKLP